MSDTQATIRITADASGVEPGVASAKNALGELGAFVKGTAESLGPLLGKYGEVAAAAGAAIETVGKAIGSVTQATVQYTTDVERLSKSFGISYAAADGFHAALSKLGIQTSTATGLAARMAQQLSQNEGGFNRLGIATRDNEGHFRNLQDIFLDGLDKLRGYQDGTDRASAAQILFGQNVGDLTQVIQLNRQALEDGARTARELGLQTTGEGVAAMHQYQQAVAEVSVVWDAFKVQIGRELLPYLTELAEWFRANGPTAIHETVTAIRYLIAGFRLVLEIPSMLEHDFTAAYDVLGALTEDMNRRIGATEGKVVVAGNAMYLALTGRVSEAAQVWRTGMADIERRSAAAAKDVADKWRAAGNEIEAVNREIDAITAQRTTKPPAGGILGTGNPPACPPPPPPSRGGGGGSAGEGRQEQASRSRMDGWEKELADRKRTFAEEQDAANTFRTYDAGQEAAYWRQILDTQKLSTDERKAVLDKWLQAHGEARKQEFQAQIDNLQKQISAAKDNGAEQIRLAQQVSEAIKRKYGENSAEYKRALEDQRRITDQATEQDLALQREATSATKQAALDGIASDEEAARHRVEMGRESNAQLLQEERSFEERRHQALVAAIEADLQAMQKDPNRSVTALRKLYDELEAEDRRYQSARAKIDQQSESDSTKRWRQTISEISSSWGQAIGKMVTLQASFASTIKSLWQGLQQAIGNAISSIIQNWLDQQLTALLLGGAKQKAAAVAQIADNAAVAASGAYAATAAIPFVGPELAPEAASLAYVGAMGWTGALAVPFAEDGWWQVPNDTLAAIHADEMVLPAWAASPLRSMISGAANTNAPFAANDVRGTSGAPAFHYHDHSGRLTPDQIRANKGAFVRMLREAHREFALKPLR